MCIVNIVWKEKSLKKALDKITELKKMGYKVKTLSHKGLGTRNGNKVCLTQTYGEKLVEAVICPDTKHAYFEFFGISVSMSMVA